MIRVIARGVWGSFKNHVYGGVVATATYIRRILKQIITVLRVNGNYLSVWDGMRHLYAIFGVLVTSGAAARKSGTAKGSR